MNAYFYFIYNVNASVSDYAVTIFSVNDDGTVKSFKY